MGRWSFVLAAATTLAAMLAGVAGARPAVEATRSWSSVDSRSRSWSRSTVTGLRRRSPRASATRCRWRSLGRGRSAGSRSACRPRRGLRLRRRRDRAERRRRPRGGRRPAQRGRDRARVLAGVRRGLAGLRGGGRGLDQRQHDLAEPAGARADDVQPHGRRRRRGLRCVVRARPQHAGERRVAPRIRGALRCSADRLR